MKNTQSFSIWFWFFFSVPPWISASASFSVLCVTTWFNFCDLGCVCEGLVATCDVVCDSHITALLFSAPVDPRLGFDDDEADMDRWTPRWLPSLAPPPPPPVLPVTVVRPLLACWGEWLVVVPLLLLAAPAEAVPPALEGSTVRRDNEDPDRLPSLSTWRKKKKCCHSL